ncbi:hypothetical protein AKJ64_04740 [candidate division MSBL1 archaeon SCGC-AAA259E17]|nr:hypothetical protein AKJ64_04740 [candidate division MSBL1 archaeon SCGC-AAA259E17]
MKENENISEERKKGLKTEIGLKKDDYQTSPKIWPFSASVARKMLYSAVEKGGIENKQDEDTGRYELRVHSTRKFFRTSCQLSDDVRNALLGHFGKLDRSYTRIMETDRPEKECKEKMSNLEFFREGEEIGEELKRQLRISQFEDLRLIAESAGLSEQKIEALERKAKMLQQLRKAGFDTDENPPEGYGCSEQTVRHGEGAI